MKLWTVLRREYLERVRSKSFLVGLILGPVFMGLIVLLPALLAGSKISEQRTIGVIDPSGAFFEPLRRALTPAGEGGDVEGVAPLEGRYTILPITVEGRSLDQAVAELKEVVRDESVHGGIVIAADFVESRRVTFYGKSVAAMTVQNDLRRSLLRVLREARFASAGVPDSLHAYLIAGVAWSNIAVGDEGVEAEVDEDSPFMVAFVLIMFIYVMVLSYGTHTLTAVVEEKSNRVFEVLLSSVSPGTLMAGKVFGIGLAGLTQMGIWTLAFLLLSQRGISVGSFTLDTSFLTPLIFLSFLVFFLLGFFLYALLFAGAGAMCNTVQDSQQFTMPLIMGLVLPMMLLTLILRAPDSPVSVVLSLIPMFAPVLMFMRVCIQTPPLWQIVLSWGLLLAAIWLASRAAGKLFRLGILMYGTSPTWATLVRALRQA
jgi:ABC-2 type transport system permease protein